MNTGIQDGWSLGWKLTLVSRSLTNESLLDSYNAERRPVGQFLVCFIDGAFSVATSTIRWSARAAPRE
jgi:2-polyprenyl-6-methoxyphenol hydroxylase-like FAD-dependent oxidoreductase